LYSSSLTKLERRLSVIFCEFDLTNCDYHNFAKTPDMSDEITGMAMICE